MPRPPGHYHGTRALSTGAAIRGATSSPRAIVPVILVVGDAAERYLVYPGALELGLWGCWHVVARFLGPFHPHTARTRPFLHVQMLIPVNTRALLLAVVIVAACVGMR